MILNKFFKSPADRKRYVVNYDDWLDSDELINSVNAVSDMTTDDFYVDGYVVSDDKKEVIFYVSGGDVGLTHVVTITIYTDRQQIKEDTIVFTISYEGRNP